MHPIWLRLQIKNISSICLIRLTQKNIGHHLNFFQTTLTSGEILGTSQKDLECIKMIVYASLSLKKPGGNDVFTHARPLNCIVMLWNDLP